MIISDGTSRDKQKSPGLHPENARSVTGTNLQLANVTCGYLPVLSDIGLHCSYKNVVIFDRHKRL